MTRMLVLCALAASACSGTAQNLVGQASKKAAGDFYPLAIDTSWTYEITLLGETRTLDVTMLRKTNDGFVEDSTGAQFLVDGFGVRDQKRYLLRNPVQAGTKWTNVVSVSSVEVYEIVAADQPCEAPAGKWDGCVVVESRNRVEEGTALVNEMTFAPGVGIVRLSTTLESNGKKIPQSSLALVKMKSPQG